MVVPRKSPLHLYHLLHTTNATPTATNYFVFFSFNIRKTARLVPSQFMRKLFARTAFEVQTFWGYVLEIVSFKEKI